VAEVSLQEAYEKWSDDVVRFATVLIGPDEAADVVADAFVEFGCSPTDVAELLRGIGGDVAGAAQ
jgi:hypothetical protein